jgi:hypothetical protein
MRLRDIPTEDLKAELNRREKSRLISKPEMIDHIDNSNVDKLRSLCRKYIDAIDIKGCVDDDHALYIFEEALEVFFGIQVWEWINSKVE